MTITAARILVPDPSDVLWPVDRPFSAREAHEAGLRADRLTSLVSAGVLRRPTKGVYVDAQLEDTLDLRAAVLRLVVPDGYFLTDRVAAWLHGADMALAPGDHLAVPRLTVYRLPSGSRLRRAITVSGERTVLPRELTVVRGLVVTTPLRTAMDLGRLQPRDLAMAGLDALLRHGLYDVDQLVEELPRMRGLRGVRQLRTLLPLADAGSESAGESALKLRWDDAGLRRCRCQVPVLRPDGRHWWIDLGDEEERIGAEYDGEAWHSSPAQRAADALRRAYLRDEAGWLLGVFTREHVFGPRQDATERLRQLWRSRVR